MKNWGLTWTLGLFIFCDKFVKRKRALQSVLMALDGSGSMAKKIAVLLALGPASLSHEKQGMKAALLEKKDKAEITGAFYAQNSRLPLQGILIPPLIILHLLKAD